MSDQPARKTIRLEYRGQVPPTEISFDTEVECVYIRLGSGKVVRTVEHAPNVMVDLDGDGHIVGVELTGDVQNVQLKAVGERYMGADAALRGRFEDAVRYAVAG